MTLFDPAAYFFNWYTVPPLAAAVFLFFLALAVLIRERMSPVSLTFSLLVMSGVIWLTSYGGIFSSRDESTAILWIYIENCGVVLIPTFLLLFSLVVVQKLYRYRILIWSGYALSYFFLLVTPFTDWMVSGAYQYSWGYYTKYGPLAKWFFVFFAVMMSAALYVLWEEYRGAQSFVRQHRFRICPLRVAALIEQFLLVAVFNRRGIRDAWPHAQHISELTRIKRFILQDLRARPHKTHVSPQYVPQLGQLI